MPITTRAVQHQLDGETFESLLVLDDAKQGRRPVVLVFHAWEGRSADQEKFARKLTAWGYAAFAVDLFGKGKTGSNPQECQALMMPMLQDRPLLRRRILEAFKTVQTQPEVDAAQIGAIGFCFGGLCALDLARAGAKVKAVASFHGNLTPPDWAVTNPIDAKIIAFHGWDDPHVSPELVMAFCREFTAAKADWQLHAYGGTMHAFTNDNANLPQMGLLYSKRAATRAWNELEPFLAEAFSG